MQNHFVWYPLLQCERPFRFTSKFLVRPRSAFYRLTLFCSEENVKILLSKVHPLNASSAPYNFSTTLDPLLHQASRVLNLPGRLQQSYMSLFDPISPTSPSSYSSNSSSSSNSAPLDEKYTGLILVSGYNVSFLLPKELPTRMSDMTTPTRSSSGRRMSSSAHVQFVAVIDVWVPFLSKPPLSPYLVRF